MCVVIFAGLPNGFTAACLLRFTKKGSIDGTILCHILMTIDKLDLMKRSEYPNATSFFLCDAHGSRLLFKFLTYINNQQNRWQGFLGCPNSPRRPQMILVFQALLKHCLKIQSHRY